MATPDPRHAYVVFYQSVLKDLDDAIVRVRATDTGSREALSPFARSLAVINASLGASARLASEALWRPTDPAQLTGLTDIYEVVGRFSFQGEDDSNLAAVGTLAQAVRTEIDRQRAALRALADVPSRVNAHADSLDAQDQATARAQQLEALKQFEPVGVELRKLASTLLDAIRAVRRPDLARPDVAETLYQDYVTRVGALYGRALPYLRGELVEMSRVAGCEVPPSWPETLPFAATLPSDLVATPSTEGPELLQARAAVVALGAQGTALQRAQDELGVQLRRAEGEAASLVQRDPDFAKDLTAARTVVKWAAKLDEVDLLRAQAGGMQAEALQRRQLLSQLQAEAQRIAAQIAVTQAEATEWLQLATAREAAVAQQRDGEPALFGKDEWRRKLDEVEAQLADARSELARRQQGMAVMNAEIGKLRTRDQTEQNQIAAVMRSVDETRARETAVLRDVAEIEKELGAARPARRLTVAQAEESIAALQAVRAEAKSRVERLGVEARRIREDLDRAAVQLKQVAAELQRQQALVVQGSQSAAVAQADALRVLAARRQAGFESHVAAVLSGLEESLTQVDRVFVEPARRILMDRFGGGTGASTDLRAEALELAKALPEIQRRADESLGPLTSTLERIQHDFVEKAAEACRAAWA